MTTVPTYTVRLYMAGDIDHAKRLLRDECYNRGLCVTVEATTFIYTGGEESGFVVGFVNYPRFPSEFGVLLARAVAIAKKLVPALNQKSALLVAPDETMWLTIDPPGAPK
jgi:hypothetical protein